MLACLYSTQDEEAPIDNHGCSIPPGGGRHARRPEAVIKAGPPERNKVQLRGGVGKDQSEPRLGQAESRKGLES
jgi:hypothetical protein